MMAAATLLVLCIIVMELYRPIIIGDAIDDYINGYQRPYVETREGAPESVPFRGLFLTREYEAIPGQRYDQIFLYQDRYYMALDLDWQTCERLKEAAPQELAALVSESAVMLSAKELGLCAAMISWGSCRLPPSICSCSFWVFFLTQETPGSCRKWDKTSSTGCGKRSLAISTASP